MPPTHALCPRCFDYHLVERELEDVRFEHTRFVWLVQPTTDCPVETIAEEDAFDASLRQDRPPFIDPEPDDELSVIENEHEKLDQIWSVASSRIALTLTLLQRILPALVIYCEQNNIPHGSNISALARYVWSCLQTNKEIVLTRRFSLAASQARQAEQDRAAVKTVVERSPARTVG